MRKIISKNGSFCFADTLAPITRTILPFDCLDHTIIYHEDEPEDDGDIYENSRRKPVSVWSAIKKLAENPFEWEKLSIARFDNPKPELLMAEAVLGSLRGLSVMARSDSLTIWIDGRVKLEIGAL